MKTREQLRDYIGRSVKRRELKEEQTSRLQGLAREFAGHPSRGLTPGKLASILSAAEGGNLIDQLDLYEDMEEKDAHIFTEMSKRKRALLGLDWTVQPPRNASAAEEKQAEQVEEMLRGMDDFEDSLFDMADAIGKGFAMLETQWARVDGDYLPRLTYRPSRWFTVDPDHQDTLLLRSDAGQHEELWPMGWVQHVHKAKSGYVARAGLHRVLAWPYLFKNYSVRDLAEFLEIYGIPLRLGTYPRGATDNEKSTLLRAVTSIGHHAAGIIPEGMMMEFKEAAKGTGDTFKVMMDWCEESVSKAVLGGTLTTTAKNTGLGSGLGDIHDDVRRDLLISDARQIASTLTRDLIYPLALLNIPGVNPRRAPRLVFETEEPEDIKLMSGALPALVDIGLHIPRDWAHKKLQIPEAEENEPVLGRARAAAPPEPPPVTAAAKAVSQTEPDTIDRYTDRLQREGQDGIEQMINQVRGLLDDSIAQGLSVKQFENRLLSVYGDLDPAELARVMQFGLATADLAGRFESIPQNESSA